MKLIVQMTAINVIFHVVVPDYQLSLEFALVPHVILQWPIVPYLQDTGYCLNEFTEETFFENGKMCLRAKG